MKQRGFTLIELVMSCLIFGTLAVTSVPRFLGLDVERADTLQTAKAAVNSGLQLVYAKSWVAEQQETAFTSDVAPQINIEGVAVNTHYGYPLAQSTQASQLLAWSDLREEEWTITQTDQDAFALTPKGVTYTAEAKGQCQLIYTQPKSAHALPTVDVQDSGC